MSVEILHILHLEDSQLDAQLVHAALEKAKLEFQLDWVDNFADYRSALTKCSYGLILTDYSLPDCDGLQAFEAARLQSPQTPVILVTGALGEELAIDTIKAGVTDYVLKGNLARLRTVVPRAIETSRNQLEKQQALSALKLSEERFDLAVRGSGAGIWDWADVANEQMWWSPRLYEILGFADGEIPATRSQLYSRMPPEVAVEVKAAMQAHFDSGVPYDTEFQIYNKSEQLIWLRSRGQALAVAGKPTRMAGYVQDISDRKIVQAALVERQRDLMKAQEVANIGCWTYSIDEDRLYWPPVVYQIFGFTPETFSGTVEESLSRVHPADLERVEAEWQRALQEGHLDYEHRLLVEGEVRWVREVAEIEYDQQGRPVKAFGVVHDLTRQRRAEAEQHKADQLYRVITQGAHDAIVMLNRQGEVVFWNPAAERIFGYQAAEVKGNVLHEILFPDNAPQQPCLCACLKEVINSGATAGYEFVELTVQNKAAQKLIIEMNASAIYQDDQWYALGLIRDITERKQAEAKRSELEQQLRQTQKMEAIGTLAGGIAHDFNNILASILGYAGMAARNLPEESREMQDLGEVLKAAERAKQLVRQILAFSRKSEKQLAPVYLDLVAKEVLQLLRASLPSTIEVKTKLEADGEAAFGDATQIHQVLMNLCTNAYHAMPDGGTLTLKLTVTDLPQEHWSGLTPGRYLELLVADSGSGIAPEIIEKIFDPYFTTKDVDSGTGLGLSVVRGIVLDMNGHISVTSNAGQGSCFRVLLPCVEDVVAPVDTFCAVENFSGSETILLVDDELALAQLGQQYLEELGYQVNIETDSLAALARIKAEPQKYDLVVTDQTMPKLTGINLAKQLKLIVPQLPVILCSGLPYSLESPGISETSICHFLLKTDLLQELPKTVRGIFDR